jgi:hypothetical protein
MFLLIPIPLNCLINGGVRGAAGHLLGATPEILFCCAVPGEAGHRTKNQSDQPELVLRLGSNRRHAIEKSYHAQQPTIGRESGDIAAGYRRRAALWPQLP